MPEVRRPRAGRDEGGILSTTTHRNPAHVWEDLQFILDNGGSREEAAKRLGFPTVRALIRYLERHAQ